MNQGKHLHYKWNWQLSSSPEQLWLYVADTNRLFKDLDLPNIQIADRSHQLEKSNPRLSYNSIKHSETWVEEPFEWEYPYRYWIKRNYTNGPFSEVKIQIDLFPNRKGTRLQYQFWAEQNNLLSAAISTFKYKTIYKARLNKTFKYYDDLIEKRCLPFESRIRQSILPRSARRFHEIRQALIDANSLNVYVENLGVSLRKKSARFRSYAGRTAQHLRGWQRTGLGLVRRLVRGMRLREALRFAEAGVAGARRWFGNRLRPELIALGRGCAQRGYRLGTIVYEAIPRARLRRAATRYRVRAAHLVHRLRVWQRGSRRLATRHHRRYRKRLESGLVHLAARRHHIEAGLRRSLLPRSARRLNQFRQTMVDVTGLEDLTGRLLDFIQQADDIDLLRIEPFQLADYWQVERKDVLFVFLHAVNEGLLIFNWDLYCPSCRTVQHTCSSLNEVHEPVFCYDCSSNFSVNFNQSLQLSFRPSPCIRRIHENKYCLSNPLNKPHIAIQQSLEPAQKRYLKTRLENGIYRLWTKDSHGSATVIVTDNGQDTIHIRLSEKGFKGEQVEICNEPNLIFENRTQNGQYFILEKVSWRNTGVTAAQVTSLQTFRDLFAQEVLQKGEKIAVDRLTLMFTDLFDSTAMYRKEGDNQAVGRVIEHFEILQHAVASENGALVKTIGDSIMAVFSDPDQAFRAFMTAQKTISENVRFGKSLKLKAGIHHGNCVAVNLNNRIDYFGSTVNIASRLVDLASENEIIISECVSQNHKVSQLLTDNSLHYTVVQESANLKGFDREMFNINRIRFEKSMLRLAI